jgi:hypothetical protein
MALRHLRAVLFLTPETLVYCVANRKDQGHGIGRTFGINYGKEHRLGRSGDLGLSGSSGTLQKKAKICPIMNHNSSEYLA